jgi:hypothetical protein
MTLCTYLTIVAHFVQHHSHSPTPLFQPCQISSLGFRDSTGFHVEGYEKIEYDFTFLDGVFEPQNVQLAKLYERWGRCLAIMDKNIYDLYGAQMQRYFALHNLPLQVHQTMIGEKAKSLETFTSIVDSMTVFGIIRKEPVLVLSSIFGRLKFTRTNLFLSQVTSPWLLFMGSMKAPFERTCVKAHCQRK